MSINILEGCADIIKRTYTYASAYAIQVTHIYQDESELAPFLSEDGQTTTEWACQALLFDSESEALERMLTIDMPIDHQGDENAYLRVVELELSTKVRVVANREIARRAA